MRAFEEMVAAAQVGVGRAPLGAGVLGLEGLAREVAILELGALGLMRRAGRVGTAQASLPVTPPEGRRVAHASAEGLEEAFALKAEEAVFEWADAAARAGFVAPHEALPLLLGMTRGGRGRVAPVLGERGRWLAGLMGVELAVPPDEDPGAARAALREEFDTLDYREMVRQLGIVARNALPEDEPLLTRAFEDRRKEVRDTGVDGLARLPGSAVAGELRSLAEGVLRGGGEVVPPDLQGLPAWLPRAADRGKGQRAQALLDVVRRVPPRVWTEATGLGPGEIFDRTAKEEYAEPFAEALQWATLRFLDQAWIDEIFRRDGEGFHARGDFVSLASDAAFEAKLRGRLLESARDAWWLVSARKRPLSSALSRRLVEAARESLPTPYGDAREALGVYLHPSVLPMLDETWQDESGDVRERWRKILDVRRRLLESLR